MSSHSGGGGGDLLSLICPELGVAPLVDPGMDLEDELPTPAASPVTVDHGAAPRSTQVELDVDLDRVFQDIATLPELVTPLCDPEGGDCGGVSGAGNSWCWCGHRRGRWIAHRHFRRFRWCPRRREASHLSSSSLFGGEPAGRDGQPRWTSVTDVCAR